MSARLREPDALLDALVANDAVCDAGRVATAFCQRPRALRHAGPSKTTAPIAAIEYHLNRANLNYVQALEPLILTQLVTLNDDRLH